MDKELDHYGNCPECGESWDGGRIWEIWKAMKDCDYYQNKTDEELQAMEKESYSEPYHFSKLMGIEDPDKYDGVSWWHCPFCKSTWDRFTGRLVGKKDYGIKKDEGDISGAKGIDVGDKGEQN